jgi:hypothetical protein
VIERLDYAILSQHYRRGSNRDAAVSAWDQISKVEYDLIRMALDPDRSVPLSLRFGLFSWLAERYYPW